MENAFHEPIFISTYANCVDFNNMIKSQQYIPERNKPVERKVASYKPELSPPTITTEGVYLYLPNIPGEIKPQW